MHNVFATGVDFMTEYDEWLRIQVKNIGLKVAIVKEETPQNDANITVDFRTVTVGRF